MKVLDHHIEYVTKPMLEPIVGMYELEGAQFIANAGKDTPYSNQAQRLVAGDIQDSHPFYHNDTQESSSRTFGNDVPWIREDQAG